MRAVSDETLADLKLALTEACSNSVRHAYGDGDGHVDISFELRDDRLIVEVADDGAGFEHDAEPTNGDEELSEGGLGIAIIRSIADEVEIGGGPNGTRLASPLRQAALRLALPMSARRKLIVVSNRGPISLRRARTAGGSRSAAPAAS